MTSPRMRKPLLRSRRLWIPVGVLLAMQCVPLPWKAPPVNGVVPASPEARAILNAACWDCHSSETRWPAYHRIAPVSWLMGWHVSHGREYLNFTDWNRLDGRGRAKASLAIERVLETGDMPLASYTLMHREARLTEEQTRVLIDWARSLAGEGSSP